ncbi:MAG: 4Fe-4S binding protein, partial [Desulfuromonadales bacterium]|nr:4Fe-4S binding protein [Desulfuromonadales bacterium]
AKTFSKYTSNWSERHIGFVAGLGTFGLSKGIITEKGMAGRMTSVITDLTLPVIKRAYKNTYEYCTMCGACVKNCPAKAISVKTGKDHKTCSNFLEMVKEKEPPYYACGKCQVKVPCEGNIPVKGRKADI